MSILKYKDPKTGEFKRINPYKADLSFVGKDGIVVNKATDSEKVEISGKGCVQRYSGPKGYRRAYITDETNWDTYTIIRQKGDNSANTLIQRKADGSGEIVMPETPVDLSITNKKYVEANYVAKVKFTNLEQALNGYILDTTEEAYADLDSAVLKNSVAVGDNVYPIADKTRALVTRIEGKTTKMVQLLDKSVIPATSTVNGITYTNNNDGSITINGTATAESYIVIVKRDKITDGHKMLYGSEQNTSDYGLAWGTNLATSKFNTSIINNNYTVKVNSGVTVDNVKIYPQLFDLTAMNREDITTVEQFKAEFPEFYPYENGNIYPAKISGVKFTEKNLFNFSKFGFSAYAIRNATIVEKLKNGVILKGNVGGEPGKQFDTNGWYCPGHSENCVYLKSGWTVTISANYQIIKSDYGDSFVLGIHLYGKEQFTSLQNIKKGEILRPYSKFKILETGYYFPIFTLNSNLVKITDIQVEISDAPTAYEPYIEPVSVTLPETYDLHGIDDNKDYLEITKNENNELYTLKKVQNIGSVDLGTLYWQKTSVFYVNEIDFIKSSSYGLCKEFLCIPYNKVVDYNRDFLETRADKNLYFRLSKESSYKDMAAIEFKAAMNGVMLYYALATPVETVIATNLTYEQVTAIRHNGGLIEVEGNTNKAYAKPTIKNTIVYRLTATNTAEG